LIYNGVVKIVE